jgi:predicted AAA+ superfamily ATPase
MPRYGKTNETILSPKKVYAADLGIRNLLTGFRDKGALFENAVYLTIRSLKPRYIYQEGVEIDFYTENKILIEAKYGNEMNSKQLDLFNKFKANEKMIVKNVRDYEKLELLS